MATLHPLLLTGIRAAPAPAPAAAPAAIRRPRLTFADAGMLVCTSVLFALAVRNSSYAAQLAFYIFSYVTIMTLTISRGLTDILPAGSPAAAWASRAVGLSSACFFVSMAWQFLRITGTTSGACAGVHGGVAYLLCL